MEIEGHAAGSAGQSRPPAGGTTLKLLPRIEAALDARRVPFRVERTRGLEHGVERALRAVEAGELPVVVSGDGLIGAVGGAMAGAETPLGIIPGGRGNDLARVLGIPDDRRRRSRRSPPATRARIDVGEANGKRFLGIVSVGFDSEANRLANETQARCAATSSTPTRRCARWSAGSRPASRSGSTRSATRFTGYSVSVANSRAFGGGMFVAPDAELDDGQFDVVTVGEVGKLRFLGNLPKVFKGTHVEERRGAASSAPPHLELSASRPFPVYADGEHLTDLPATLRVLPRALSVIVPPAPAGVASDGARRLRRQARAPRGRSAPPAGRSGRGGGTTLPGRVLLRLAPDAIARLGAGLDRGVDAGQRHQRQDDHGRDDRRAARAPTGRDAGPQPRRLEHDLGSRHGAARAARQRGPVRGRRGLAAAGRRRSSTRPLIVLGNLFRDQLDRYGEIEALADEWAKTVAERAGRTALRPQRRRPADRRPRPRRRASAGARASSTSGSRTPRRRCPSSSTPSTPSTAAAAATPTPTSAPSSATSATTPAPTAAPSGRAPDVAATAIELHGMDGSRVDGADPGGRDRARAAPARPLQRLQRARGDRGGPASWASRRSGSRRRWRRCGRPSAGSRRSRSASKPVSILLIKNPAGANEVLRTLRLEADGGGLDLWIALNDRIADGRDVSWIWDADFELLAGARPPGRPAPAPGRRRWRCG